MTIFYSGCKLTGVVIASSALDLHPEQKGDRIDAYYCTYLIHSYRTRSWCVGYGNCVWSASGPEDSGGNFNNGKNMFKKLLRTRH